MIHIEELQRIYQQAGRAIDWNEVDKEASSKGFIRYKSLLHREEKF